MMSINPFSALAETISSSVIQGFILAMLALIVIGTVVQMIHHKNVTYFFNNAKKAKLAAERELGVGEKTSVILKTVVHDIATTAELGAGKRRVAHVMGMYGTILFWVASVVLVFGYTGTGTSRTNNLAYDLACWSNNDLCGWILVLVIFKSRCTCRSSSLVQNY